MALARPRKRIVFVVGFLSNAVLALGLSGCNKKPAAQVAVTPSPAARSIGKPLTDEECLAVAEAIDEAADSGDAAALDRLIDWDTVVQRSTGGIDANDQVRKGFIKGLENSRVSGKGLAGGIVEAIKKGGSYTLLRSHTRDNSRWLLFRLLLPESGVNYYDLLLARRPDGKVKAVDIHIYLSGELFSQTLRRAYLQLAAKTSGGLVERLTGSDQQYLKHFARLGDMAEAVRANEFARALEIYRSFPPELQKDKTVLLGRLQAAQNVGNEGEYAQSIEDFRKEYPSDACIDILSIDYYFLKKRYQEALDCIDRVDKALGGDPYLQTMRAGVHIEQNDMVAARADLKKAMDDEPGLMDPYWSLVTLTLKEKNFDETLKTLRLIRDKFGVTFADLATLPLYKEFIETPQYQEWLKENKGEAGKAAGKEPAGKPEP